MSLDALCSPGSSLLLGGYFPHPVLHELGERQSTLIPEKNTICA